MSFKHILFRKRCYFEFNIRFSPNSSSKLNGYLLGTEKYILYNLHQSKEYIAMGLSKTSYGD